MSKVIKKSSNLSRRGFLRKVCFLAGTALASFVDKPALCTRTKNQISGKSGGYMMSDSFASTGYEIEWKRSQPDYLVYHPAPDGNPRWHEDDFFVLNEHFIVVPTTDGNLLATWTAWGPKLSFRRVAVSRSTDDGKTWSNPSVIEGERGKSASWQVPIVAPSGRIYLFYSKYYTDVEGSSLRCRISDDDGQSWSTPFDLSIKRRNIDNPEPSTYPQWLAWRQAEWDDQNRALSPFTRKSSSKSDVGGKWCQSECMRFENIASAPQPEELQITWLPTKDKPITVPYAENSDMSWANEPSVIPLSDGRLFMSVRTRQGTIWYTLSEDDGATFREVEVMRYRDGGKVILQPSAPAPIYKMKNGKFLLLFNNNDGDVFGAKDVHDSKNRRPAFLALGEERLNAHQPIWFSEPKMFIDNDGVPINIVGNEPRFEAASYTSLTELNGERVLWYPDRKHFLVGKIIPDEWLKEMKIPK